VVLTVAHIVSLSIRRRGGIAGQVQYDATVTYEGEEPSTVSFVGSTFGGPVVMIQPSGAQVFVNNPRRFGHFGEQWVRSFIEGTAS
jgi:hypothetical protein